MWEVMFECHKLQFHIISSPYDNSNIKISLQSEARRQITIHLENELGSLSSSFTKWISAQKTYVKALNGWLFKCVSLPQKSLRRKRRMQPPSIRNMGPPIYITCGVWLEKLDSLPIKEVADSVKGLVAEITRFLPLQEKNQGKGMNPAHSSNGEVGINLLRDEASEHWITCLVGFIGRLKNFAESSVEMFTELEKAIQEAKTSYHERSQS